MKKLPSLLVASAVYACGGSQTPATDSERPERENQPTSAPTAHHEEQSFAEHDQHANGAAHNENDLHHHGAHSGHGMQHDFSDANHWSTVFDDPARDAWQKPEEVVALTAIEAGMTVADLGAGTGYFMPYFSTAVGPAGRVLALDVENSLVEHMTKRALDAGFTNVEARLIGYDGPGMEPQTADRIVIVDTWHHLSDRIEYSKKLLSSLKPGGLLVIVDFTLDSQQGPPPQHRLSEQAVIEELVEAGFVATVAEETLPDQYVIIATVCDQ